MRVRVGVRGASLTRSAPLCSAALYLPISPYISLYLTRSAPLCGAAPHGAQRSVEGVGDVARGEDGEGGLRHGEGATCRGRGERGG